MGPSRKNAVDVPQGWVKRGLVVPAVVVDPTSDVWVEHPRQIVQRLVAALVKCPAPDSLPDRLESLTACCRAERDADPISTPLRQPRPEFIAEEVELVTRIGLAPVFILAVDDLGLLRMQRQTAFGEAVLQRPAQSRRLFLSLAVTDRIIRVPLEWDVRMVPAHPHIERVVEKEIRQQGTYHAPLRRSSFADDHATVRHLHGRLQPSLDV